MSLSNLLPAETKNEEWSKLYANEINTNLLTSANVEFGVAPNSYLMPAPLTPIDQRSVLINIDGSQVQFRILRRVTFSYGANANANPSWLAANGTTEAAAGGGFSQYVQLRAPFDMRLRNLSMVSNNGNATTEWEIYQTNVLALTFTFGANGTYAVPGNGLLCAGGERLSIAWRGTGTQPNNTTITMFFEEATIT